MGFLLFPGWPSGWAGREALLLGTLHSLCSSCPQRCTQSCVNVTVMLRLSHHAEVGSSVREQDFRLSDLPHVTQKVAEPQSNQLYCAASAVPARQATVAGGIGQPLLSLAFLVSSWVLITSSRDKSRLCWRFLAMELVWVNDLQTGISQISSEKHSTRAHTCAHIHTQGTYM